MTKTVNSLEYFEDSVHLDKIYRSICGEVRERANQELVPAMQETGMHNAFMAEFFCRKIADSVGLCQFLSRLKSDPIEDLINLRDALNSLEDSFRKLPLSANMLLREILRDPEESIPEYIDNLEEIVEDFRAALPVIIENLPLQRYTRKGGQSARLTDTVKHVSLLWREATGKLPPATLKDGECHHPLFQFIARYSGHSVSGQKWQRVLKSLKSANTTAEGA